MYEGFKYVSEQGLMKKTDYKGWQSRQNSCQVKSSELQSKRRIFDIGYVEKDGRTNEEFKSLL